MIFEKFEKFLQMTRLIEEHKVRVFSPTENHCKQSKGNHPGRSKRAVCDPKTDRKPGKNGSFSIRIKLYHLAQKYVPYYIHMVYDPYFASGVIIPLHRGIESAINNLAEYSVETIINTLLCNKELRWYGLAYPSRSPLKRTQVDD